MLESKIDLSKFDPSKYSHGKSKIVYMIWHLINFGVFQKGWMGSSGFRVFLLRTFGAKIGKGVVMNKPRINIKYPWKLEIGDFSWLGEGCWIYNMDDVKIGSHVNIAQNVMLLTGNHNFQMESFDVFTKPICVEDGVFVGASSTIAPGVKCGVNSIISVGSIVLKDTVPNGVYGGNPAQLVKMRS